MHGVCGYAYRPTYGYTLKLIVQAWLESELRQGQCVVLSHNSVVLLTDNELGAWSHGKSAILTRLIIESNTL